jgi:hypothetical protein
MRYILYGLLLDSELPLPLPLAPVSRELPDVFVRVKPVRVRGELILRPQAVLPFSCWRAGANIILEWPDARFEIGPTHIDVDTAHPEAAAHYLMQGAWSVLLTARGREALHASVVSREGRSLAIMGASGNGKSTASLALIDQGWSLVSDDVLILNDEGMALPGPQFMRLVGTAAEGRSGHWDGLGKFRYEPPTCETPSQLAWVIVLSDRYDRLRPLAGVEAIDAIVTHVYNDIHTHPGQLHGRLDLALQVTSSAQVFGAPPRSLTSAVLNDLTETKAGVA